MKKMDLRFFCKYFFIMLEKKRKLCYNITKGAVIMKKALYSTLFYHALCLFSVISGHLLKNNSIMIISFWADIAGAVVFPLIISVAAMVISVREDSRVLKLYPNAAATVGVVGLARGILFFTAGGLSGFRNAMIYLLFSFILLTVWFLIFEISSGFMNRGTKINRKITKKRK